MFSVVIPDKDVPVLCGNSFGMFAGKRTVRQPLKYSLILISPVMPRTGGAVITVSPIRTGYRLKTRNPHPLAVEAEAPAARPYIHGLSFSRYLFSYWPPPVVPAEADR